MKHCNTNIVLPKQSFIAVINYKPETEELYIVIRKNGKRYKYLGVPTQIFTDIMQAGNKGSYIAQNIINGPYKAEEMPPVPMARLEAITQATRYAKAVDQYTNRYYWLGI
jgi:uncharacterized protein YuzE